MTSPVLKKTPLYDSIVKLGGKVVDFHGWALPVQFEGILKEHKAVRSSCGLFDVSHMGQVFVKGPDAHKFLQHINSNNVRNEPGRGVYSHVLNSSGGLIDDVINFCIGDNSFFVIVNSATTEKDFDWFRANSKNFNVQLENASDRFGMLALQGPRSLGIMQKLCADAIKLKRFGIMEAELFGEKCFVTRTGYTGEDGFEVCASHAVTVKVWDFFIKEGALPCGLGARDTLRLEAGYLLYGQDVDDNHNSYEAGYGWVVKMNKGDFIGKTALENSGAEKGIKTRLTGFVLTQAGIARPGYAVYRGVNKIGELTSATFSPTIGMSIGMGYMPVDIKEGDFVEVEIHSKRVQAKVCKMPFYNNKV